MSIGHNVKKTEDDEENDLPPPPDGGWGWAVVFGSFMIHIITDGVTYSFGVFYDEFLDYFNEGKGATAWILSILVGVTLCSGPISSGFVNKWGCRAVTIAGAIIASICMIISSRAQNVTTMYFTIGIGTGLGFGLIYLPAIVSVTTYFEKRRSLATGIAVCGSGFGTFVFAPIINLLLSEYGWRGAMLIIAALVLECVLFGALFRPLEYTPSENSNGSRMLDPIELDTKHTDKIMASSNTTELQRIDNHKNNNEKTYEDEVNDNKVVYYSKINGNAVIERNGDYDHHKKTNIERPRSMGHFSVTKPIKSSTLDKNGRLYGVKFISPETSRLALSHPVLSSIQLEGGRHHHYGSQHLRRPRPLDRRDVFYPVSLSNISSIKAKTDANNTDENETMLKRHSISRRGRSVSPEIETTVCGVVPCSRESRETLKAMLNFSLLKDPLFIVFSLSNFFTSIGFNIPYVYIVPKAKALDISAENASMLLSVIGIANTIGRIILGYVSDNPKINRLLVYNTCLTICGVATALSAFCVDFYSLAFYGTVFGFTIGAYVGLTSVILVDLLGLEKLTNAFGLLLLFQGIASLIGPPIAGELYDLLESYDPGFYVSGITIALSGLMLFSVPSIQKWQEKKQNALQSTPDI